MELFIEITAVIMGVIGLLGCILPILPGPPLSYIALVLQYFFTNHPGTSDEITGRFMIIWLIITIVVTVLDYIVPDVVHVLKDGKIVKTAGRELVAQIEEAGYDSIV